MTEGGSKECALDIADKANASGALLMVGIEEDGEGRAVRLAPVENDEDLGLRVHQIVAQRLSPPPLLTHRSVGVDGGQIHLFTIAPTTRSPHGVAVGGDALRFPVRSGVTRRFLSEPELADRYQRRFQAGADQRGRLDASHQQALAVVPDKGAKGEPWSWLVVSAVPELPGQLSLRRGLTDKWREWLNPALVNFPTFGRGTLVGYLAVSAELVSEKPMLIGQHRSAWTGQLEGTRAVPSTTGRSEHVAPLDGLAEPGPDRIALARLLALDLLSAFGMSEVPQITESDEFVLNRFTHESQPKVERWAEEAGVRTTLASSTLTPGPVAGQWDGLRDRTG